jgi:hypothetical protein
MTTATEGIIDPQWEPLVGVFLTVLFVVLLRARMDAKSYGKGSFGIFDNPFIFGAFVIVPVMTHFWHLLFGEGSIAEYGGSTFFSIFTIDTSDWIVWGGWNPSEGIGLDGALINTYEFTTTAYMVLAYSLIHLYYKNSNWLVNPTSGFLDSNWPGVIYISLIFLAYSGIFTFNATQMWWVDFFFFWNGLWIAARVWD